MEEAWASPFFRMGVILAACIMMGFLARMVNGL